MHTPPIASNLPTKILVARRWATRCDACQDVEYHHDTHVHMFRTDDQLAMDGPLHNRPRMTHLPYMPTS